jgi:ring-1,2-phenylacetyl-CoA epoxidase subunit PaaB
MTVENDHWTLWEVFVQPQSGEPHEHVGSVRAPDKEMALQNGRDVYTRRGRVGSIWVVRSSEIVSSLPADSESFFDPSQDKIYRHPQFYKVPRGLRE